MEAAYPRSDGYFLVWRQSLDLRRQAPNLFGLALDPALQPALSVELTTTPVPRGVGTAERDGQTTIVLCGVDGPEVVSIDRELRAAKVPSDPDIGCTGTDPAVAVLDDGAQLAAWVAGSGTRAGPVSLETLGGERPASEVIYERGSLTTPPTWSVSDRDALLVVGVSVEEDDTSLALRHIDGRGATTDPQLVSPVFDQGFAEAVVVPQSDGHLIVAALRETGLVHIRVRDRSFEEPSMLVADGRHRDLTLIEQRDRLVLASSRCDAGECRLYIAELDHDGELGSERVLEFAEDEVFLEEPAIVERQGRLTLFYRASLESRENRIRVRDLRCP
ncbi:MAG: hypothetical protein AAGF12_06680 [Myxococcota bacterium]